MEICVQNACTCTDTIHMTSLHDFSLYHFVVKVSKTGVSSDFFFKLVSSLSSETASNPLRNFIFK